jgi:hypothetical protein
MFGFVYEDFQIEDESIKKYLNPNNKLNGLMILSGGCTMFKISKYFSNGSLISVDFNQDQVNLVKDKIDLLENNPQKYNDFISNINMPFDNLFVRIKNGELFEDVFSNDNLISQFGDSAVSNTSENFISHFTQISKNNSNKDEYDWIWKRDLDKKKLTPELKENLPHIKKTFLVCSKFEEYLYPNTYDFIQTSNLTDWMDKITFDLFCQKLLLSLKPNGILVMRRLLSDNILFEKFPSAIKLNDKTNFYKETICFIKNN